MALYNVPTAAKLLSVSERTLRTLIKESKIEFVRIGHSIRISEESIENFISQNTERGIKNDEQ